MVYDIEKKELAENNFLNNINQLEDSISNIRSQLKGFLEKEKRHKRKDEQTKLAVERILSEYRQKLREYDNDINEGRSEEHTSELQSH